MSCTACIAMITSGDSPCCCVTVLVFFGVLYPLCCCAHVRTTSTDGAAICVADIICCACYCYACMYYCYLLLMAYSGWMIGLACWCDAAAAISNSAGLSVANG